MKDPLQHDPDDSLGKAYEKMFERAIEKFHGAEEKTSHLLHQVIDEARDKAIGLNEVSEEEAGEIPPCPKCHATRFHRKVGAQ